MKLCAEAVSVASRARCASASWLAAWMVSTSVSCAAAAHLSPLVDYADLDGNMLIANDPYRGVRVVKGKLMLPGKPGLGLTPTGP